MQVSADVRYTLPDDWLLIKGESTRNVAATQQFPRLAKRPFHHSSLHRRRSDPLCFPLSAPGGEVAGRGCTHRLSA